MIIILQINQVEADRLDVASRFDWESTLGRIIGDSNVERMKVRVQAGAKLRVLIRVGIPIPSEERLFDYVAKADPTDHELINFCHERHLQGEAERDPDGIAAKAMQAIEEARGLAIRDLLPMPMPVLDAQDLKPRMVTIESLRPPERALVVGDRRRGRTAGLLAIAAAAAGGSALNMLAPLVRRRAREVLDEQARRQSERSGGAALTQPIDRAKAAREEYAKAAALCEQQIAAGTAPGVAFARARRSFQRLRRDYFSRPEWERSESGWAGHGPEEDHIALARRVFPPPPVRVITVKEPM